MVLVTTQRGVLVFSLPRSLVKLQVKNLTKLFWVAFDNRRREKRRQTRIEWHNIPINVFDRTLEETEERTEDFGKGGGTGARA